MRRAAFLVVSLLGFLLLLTPQAVAQDKVVVIPIGGDEATGNATVDDVVKGKTFSNSSATGLTGTRPSVPVGRSGQATSYATGDDGDLERGVAWPNPRFTDNIDGTVTDNMTGLIWLKDANCFGAEMLWANAITYANGLYDGCSECGGTDNDCGLSDGSSAGEWRLPNVKELASLIHYGVQDPPLPNTAGTGKWTAGDPFTNVQTSSYWSSSTILGDTSDAWVVNMNWGHLEDMDKSGSSYVWPVRGGN